VPALRQMTWPFASWPSAEQMAVGFRAFKPAAVMRLWGRLGGFRTVSAMSSNVLYSLVTVYATAHEKPGLVVFTTCPGLRAEQFSPGFRVRSCC